MADNEYYIGWKYRTPLTSEYLSRFMNGFTEQGLLTRPVFGLSNTNDVTISSFSFIIKVTSNDDTDKHITVTTPKNGITVSGITEDICAIGIEWKNNAPEFVLLSTSGEHSASDFTGIIVGTVYKYGNVIRVSSEGADISTFLLLREGWNPHCWVSLISPRRITDNNINIGDAIVEMRTGNERYSGFINDSYSVSNKDRYLNFDEVNFTECLVGPDNNSSKGMSVYSSGNVTNMQSGRIMAMVQFDNNQQFHISPVDSFGVNVNVEDSIMKVL